jgi:hypothetical protein
VCCATRQHAWDAPQHESRPHTHPRLTTHTHTHTLTHTHILKPAGRSAGCGAGKIGCAPLSRPSALDADKPSRWFLASQRRARDTTRTSDWSPPAGSFFPSPCLQHRIATATAHTTNGANAGGRAPAAASRPPCLECMMRAAGRPIRPSRHASQYASCLA